MNILWTLGHKTKLQEMLDGREHRAKVQAQMLQFLPGCNLICFTLNIAGPMKVTALTDEAFYEGTDAIEQMLTNAGIFAESEIFENPYGHEAFYAIDSGEHFADEIKQLMVMIEEEHPLGRFFDIDVIDSNGNKISRNDIGAPLRRCLLCDKPAAECASVRAHLLDELQDYTTQMFASYLRGSNNGGGYTSKTVERMAYNSMMNEVATTPKPGLVDFDNNGSHTDMNPELFETSAQAIKYCFGRSYEIGWSNASKAVEPAGVLKNLRPLGIEAERKMLEATDGVNTHKGLIFSLGLICAAWGYADYNKKKSLADILDLAAQIAKVTESEESGRIGGGARMEAACGFKSITEIALPAFEKASRAGCDINTIGVFTLMKLIAGLEDTNMISRGGEDMARQMRKKAKKIADAFEQKMRNGETEKDEFLKRVFKLDEEFRACNMSPGGAADLLAITYFCKMMQDLI